MRRQERARERDWMDGEHPWTHTLSRGNGGSGDEVADAPRVVSGAPTSGSCAEMELMVSVLDYYWFERGAGVT